MQARHLSKGLNPVPIQDGAAGHHLMIPPGEKTQHRCRFRLTVGLAQHLPLTDHDGVRRNDDVFFSPADGQRLQTADPGNFVKGRLFGVHGFVNVRRPDGEGKVEEGQKRLSPRRGGRENELHKVLLSMRRDFIPHPVSTVPGYTRRGRGVRGSCNRSARGQLPWNFPW